MSGGAFEKGSDRTRAAGKAGAAAMHAKRRAAKEVQPFTGSIIDVMTDAGMTGPSWAAWRTFWRAVFALPFTDEGELRTFQRHTGRATPPVEPVREVWQAIGRRGGKSRNAAVGSVFLAVRRDYAQVLAPGERGVIPVIAADRKQAGQVMSYLKAIARTERFAPYVGRVLKESVEFRTGVTVETHVASYRTTRGYSVVGLVCDEVAFWRTTDDAANPDSEVLAALRPGMLTIPGALLLGLSTPYACRGELFKAHERAFGQDDARVLVWNADTRSMNPGVDAGAIREAFEDDALAAASEYGEDGRVAFRRDVAALYDPEALRAVTVWDRRELPPVSGVEYVAFVDPSAGSHDSFCLGIAHKEGEQAVLDCVRETRPPFSPANVVAEYAALLLTYGVASVTGDRWGGEFLRAEFVKHGIEYVASELTKSDIYRELLPAVNAARVELLDVPRMFAQLVGLERRARSGGRDQVDHLPGGHDDVANAAAGALVRANRETVGSTLAWIGGRTVDMASGAVLDGDGWEQRDP